MSFCPTKNMNLSVWPANLIIKRAVGWCVCVLEKNISLHKAAYVPNFAFPQVLVFVLHTLCNHVVIIKICLLTDALDSKLFGDDLLIETSFLGNHSSSTP